jgi:thymidylate kinase
VVDLRDLWPVKGSKTPPEKNLLYYLYGRNDVIPKFADLQDVFRQSNTSIDTLIYCEPTWANIGLRIRTKTIHNVDGRKVTARDTAIAFSEDREEMTKLAADARNAGVDTYGERSVLSSALYQSSMDEPLPIDYILSLRGNDYAVKNIPDIFIICLLSAETAMKRKASREKQDDCRFEVLEFQRRIAEKYGSEETKRMLNGFGSKVVYVDTEDPRTQENTERAAVKILQKARDGTLVDGVRYNFPIVDGARYNFQK